MNAKPLGREYIRHPSDIPFVIQPESHPEQLSLELNNVSQGGLAFESPQRFTKGSLVTIKLFVVKPCFKVRGIVQWCHCRSLASNTQTTPDVTPSTKQEPLPQTLYDVGVEFIDQEDAFRVRMVEQLCHIEHYKRQVKATEGRTISGQTAAFEWIAKHAAQFPNPVMQEDEPTLTVTDEAINNRKSKRSSTTR